MYTAITVDTSCTGTHEEPMLTNNTEGLMELCDGIFRDGLCYEDFTMETAIVLCRQQGLNASNLGTGTSNPGTGTT